MIRNLGVVLMLLLGVPALRAQDKGSPNPVKPQEQYQALLKDYADARKAYREAYEKAETEKAKQRVFQEKYPQPIMFAPRFLELAEKNPADPVALESLTWIMENTVRTFGSKPGPRARAAEMLVRDHIQSDKLIRVCRNLAYGDARESTALLRAIIEKNPNKEVRAEASMALAQRLSGRARLARELKDKAGIAVTFESIYGKDYVEELQKAGVDQVEAESKQAFKDFANKFAPDVKPERLAILAHALVHSDSPGSEDLLRTLMVKDVRREVQGPACLALARMLRRRAETSTDTSVAEKVRGECEQLLERAADKYADVKFPYGGTIGKKAASELFDLRQLLVGKPAPKVEGADQDGKKFALADYRGKVVLLDFWSQY